MTASVSSPSSNSRPTPSSAAQPPAMPAATWSRNSARRWGSVESCTDSVPGSSPRPVAGPGAPCVRVTPASNQHMAPALTPHSTIPRW